MRSAVAPAGRLLMRRLHASCRTAGYRKVCGIALGRTVDECTSSDRRIFSREMVQRTR